MITLTLTLVVAAAIAGPEKVPQSGAAEQKSARAPVADGAPVAILLKDGSRLVGRVLSQDESRIHVVTAGGVALDIDRNQVDRIESASAVADSAQRPSDSNTTRLLFAPTGRPLPQGAGYFSDHYVVFPGIAYGITDNISIGAGISVVPGLSAGEQLLYAVPKVGKQFSDTFALSAGALLARGGDSEDGANLNVGFAMATFGRPDRSVTLGAGVARTVENDYTSEFVNGRFVSRRERVASHTPIVVFGGTARISNRVSFISENWLILGEDLDLSEQPFSVGVRFLGDRLSADVGLVLVGAALDEGFPIPWLSVTYHFGKEPPRSATKAEPRSRAVSSSDKASAARPEAPAQRW